MLITNIKCSGVSGLTTCDAYTKAEKIYKNGRIGKFPIMSKLLMSLREKLVWRIQMLSLFSSPIYSQFSSLPSSLCHLPLTVLFLCCLLLSQFLHALHFYKRMRMSSWLQLNRCVHYITSISALRKNFLNVQFAQLKYCNILNHVSL